ncbi:MAG: hypothetical protein IJT77_08565 [Clostridia bacterium]|nr:hypothetical protein [Clostridia bacterium]
MKLGKSYVQFSKIMVMMVLIAVTALAAMSLYGMIHLGTFRRRRLFSAAIRILPRWCSSPTPATLLLKSGCHPATVREKNRRRLQTGDRGCKSVD